jgi:hypothetical protein
MKNIIKLNNQIEYNFYFPKLSKVNLLKDVEDNELVERKKILLAELRSKTKPSNYKRYLGTPLRYAGGKTLAVGHIINLLPNNITFFRRSIS